MSSRFARDVEDITPNLIPIMNLFTALIPFLLMLQELELLDTLRGMIIVNTTFVLPFAVSDDMWLGGTTQLYTTLDPGGTWTLTVSDCCPEDTGTVLGWSVYVNATDDRSIVQATCGAGTCP